MSRGLYDDEARLRDEHSSRSPSPLSLEVARPRSKSDSAISHSVALCDPGDWLRRSLLRSQHGDRSQLLMSLSAHGLLAQQTRKRSASTPTKPSAHSASATKCDCLIVIDTQMIFCLDDDKRVVVNEMAKHQIQRTLQQCRLAKIKFGVLLYAGIEDKSSADRIMVCLAGGLCSIRKEKFYEVVSVISGLKIGQRQLHASLDKISSTVSQYAESALVLTQRPRLLNWSYSQGYTGLNTLLTPPPSPVQTPREIPHYQAVTMFRAPTPVISGSKPLPHELARQIQADLADAMQPNSK